VIITVKKLLGIIIGVMIATVGLSNTHIATAHEIQRLTAEQCSKIEEYVEYERKESNLPGVAVGIVYGNEIAYTKGFGGIADAIVCPNLSRIKHLFLCSITRG
jgi:hypothetical protein